MKDETQDSNKQADLPKPKKTLEELTLEAKARFAKRGNISLSSLMSTPIRDEDLEKADFGDKTEGLE